MKKAFVITLAIIIVIIVVGLISYIATLNTDNVVDTNNEVTNIVQEQEEENNNDNLDENAFKSININSEVAKEIFDFVPKYLNEYTNKMSMEYIIFSAINKLQEKEVKKNIYTFDGGDFEGYKASVINEKTKEMYGFNVDIGENQNFTLPIGYSKKDDAYCIFPVGLGFSEEFHTIKELKENKEKYILTIYAINIQYDIEDEDYILISTKDTFKLSLDKNVEYEEIKKSMIKYKLEGMETIEPVSVVNEYENVLPLIEYEIEKLDERGTKYVIKNIKSII